MRLTTQGTNGGFTFIASTAGQSVPLNQAWSLMSPALHEAIPIRLVGSRSSSCKLIANDDNSTQVNIWFICNYNQVLIFSSSFVNYLLQKDCKFARQKQWIMDLFVANVPKEFVFIVASEGHFANRHLVQQNTERPPIDAVIVRNSLDYLRRNILCIKSLYF